MAVTRSLIVNADDLGQSAGINAGIIKAHETGIVTSASLMVRWESARAGAAYARLHPDLSVGLHLDLGEWAFRDGEWAKMYDVAQLDNVTAVHDEIARQLEQFRVLVGRDPSHLDSHQHVHRDDPALSLLLEVALELQIPLRHFNHAVHYIGDFYGQLGDGTPLPGAISVDALTCILQDLPAGVSELGCHPGCGRDVRSMYTEERAREVQVLCDPQIRSVLHDENIELISFYGLQAAAG